ncbi:MAG: SMP-30/gluconolactonase/LRE family protein [Chloroflexi bacterium]|nr:SMP-30/gluconolactonase/LRE family protein [Chloroflexota bacterium]
MAADELRGELVLDAHARVGEGPVWDDASGTLVWVDIMGNAVHRYDPATSVDRAIDVAQPVGAAGLRRGGRGLVLALRDGFGLLDERSAQVQLVAPVEADVPSNRMNDGKCDPGGRFWAGTMPYETAPGLAALYRLDADLQVSRVVTGVTLSNGLDWSPDGRHMYYIDSKSQGVDVFDFEAATGRLGERRRLITIPADEGLPDGMTVDAEGGLWVALHASGSIRRYTLDGRVDRVVRVPVAMVTSCAFGGPDLTDLYITTMSLGMSPADRRAQPLAGGLFRSEQFLDLSGGVTRAWSPSSPSAPPWPG